MLDWPESVLPLPSAILQYDVRSSNIRSNINGGVARQRSRFRRLNTTAGVSFDLDKTQLSIFQSIWVDSLNLGNDWFMMRLPLADGGILTLTEVRFIGDYTKSHSQFENWTISADIEFKTLTPASNV